MNKLLSIQTIFVIFQIILLFIFIYLVTFLPSQTPNLCIIIFDYTKVNFNDLCSFLLDFDFSICLQSHNIEFIWTTIRSLILEAISLFVPKIHLKRRCGPKWRNADIRHHRNCLRTMKKRFKVHPTPHGNHKIMLSESPLLSKTVLAKPQYESKLIESFKANNSPAIYHYIRASTDQITIPPVIKHDNVSAVSDYHKACLFNQYFHSVFTKSYFELPPVSGLTTPLINISEITISELDVYKALSSLDTTKASGCDGISAKLLKHCAIVLYQPLHHLFSLSLCQHYIPLEWRTHQIRPIFKSGKKQDVKNYRPISLFCVVSKVLERLVFDNVIDVVRSLIYKGQFGFLKGHSSLQQLLIFWNTVINTPQTDVVYLDFRKAFDSVAHKELLFKLWNFGITGNLWRWFEAYLSDRCQFVSVGQTASFYQSFPGYLKAAFLDHSYF